MPGRVALLQPKILLVSRPTSPTSQTVPLRNQALKAYIARAARSNPKAASIAQEQFSRHDYDRIYRALTAPYGL